MRIARARLVLPARMKASAAADARQIAEAVAEALSSHAGPPARISIELPGNGRPARHMRFDLAGAAGRAAGPGRRS